MASRRTKSIGTKVTPEEYDRIHALAGDQPISEWVRAALLNAADASPLDSVVLAELRVVSWLRGATTRSEALRLSGGGG